MSDDIKQRLRDLCEQATKERSHYYVRDTATRTLSEIERLEARVAEMERERDTKIGALQTIQSVTSKNLDLARAEADRLREMIEAHNRGCEIACGVGEQEGAACGYRPYFPRRCPECPHDWKIDLPDAAREGGK